MESLGCRVKKLRKTMKLTQQDLGDIVGLHGSNIGRIESGQVLPDADIILKMAIYFDVTCDYIIRGNNAISQNFSEKDRIVINLYNRLNPNDREEILTLLNLKVSRLKGGSKEIGKLSNSEKNNDIEIA